MTRGTEYPVVIVGTGFAGYTVARELRRRDRNIGLLMLSLDDGNQYSKPMLSNAFAQKMSAAQLAGTPREQMAKRLNAEIESNLGVEWIDPVAHCLHLSDGNEIRYGKLVLAVGARARLPQFGGNAAGRLLSVNSLAEYEALRAALDGASRVAVIGAGLVGCELANDLLAGGYSVDLLDVSMRMLERFLPPDAADIVTQALVAEGVRWHPGARIESIDTVGEDGRKLTITGANGLQIACDVVITAIGLEPQTVRAVPSFETHRGIVVDRYLRTSAPDIYAIGDCAEMDGSVLPFLEPIQHGARALAATLTGAATPVHYPPMPIDVKTPAHPVRVLLPPAGTRGGWQVQNSMSAGVYATFVDEGGVIAGYALSGDQIGRENELTHVLEPHAAG
ncbi:FAD-dependent oxidoreductase [Paraburkholderia jirisanensis]